MVHQDNMMNVSLKPFQFHTSVKSSRNSVFPRPETHFKPRCFLTPPTESLFQLVPNKTRLGHRAYSIAKLGFVHQFSKRQTAHVVSLFASPRANDATTTSRCPCAPWNTQISSIYYSQPQTAVLVLPTWQPPSLLASATCPAVRSHSARCTGRRESPHAPS